MTSSRQTAAELPPISVTVLVAPTGTKDLPVEVGRTSADYEYRILTIPRGSTRAQLREVLTEQAEYGRWDLVRTRVYMGGGKRVWLRRRFMRVAGTLHGAR